MRTDHGTVTGLVSDIQRFCLHDGPGIRTVVFLKGCPLRCRWCQNPETLRSAPELFHSPGTCIDCNACATACPQKAIKAAPSAVIDWTRCDQCLACAGVCPSGALSVVGKRQSVGEVMQTVLADQPFYKRSGGGVTLSGGEPALQFEFASALLSSLRAEGVSTVIETSGAVATERLLDLGRLVDLVYFDLKGALGGNHRHNTGSANELILRNASALLADEVRVLFRLVVVPGVNDGPEDIAAMKALLKELDVREVQLLPYHRLGASKLNCIAPVLAPLGIGEATPSRIEVFNAALVESGLNVTVGGE